MAAINGQEQVKRTFLEPGEKDIERIVSTLFSEAIQKRASDIHILPMRNRVAVKYRIDGILHDIVNLAPEIKEGLIIRIKVMSNLIVYKKDIPQDGSIVLPGRNIELRVTIFPTACGEKAVIRILNSDAFPFKLDNLGFSPDIEKGYRKLVSKTHGVILLTGPANSGKTTTIYSTIQEKLRQDANCSISSLEDPVEFRFDNISQTHVKTSSGLTYAKALKSLLRQDPDVIIVGEIRDAETAKMVMEAGLTGHMVISTIHSGTAASVFVRLLEMDIEPFLMASAVSGVLAQRLLRKTCENCGGKGCETCSRTGYDGRTVIGELVVVDDILREALMGKPSLTQLKEVFTLNRVKTLLDDGTEKVKRGITSPDELEKAIQV